LNGISCPDWQDQLRCKTIVEMLQMRRDWTREFTYLDEQGRPTTYTWGHVCQMAFAYAHGLRERGVRSGDRVVLMLPTCPEYLYSFFGVIAAGAIPVPVYPPFNLKQLKQFLHTLVGVFNNSQATTIVYWKDVKAVLGQALDQAKSVRHAIAIETLSDLKPVDTPPALEISPTDPAMIQYTSGSTDMPKGVALSHLNLLHNVHNIEHCLQLDNTKDRVVSWLPLYHDMGLIGTMLGAIYSGIDMVLMGPQTFLMRPRLWLEAISKYRGTITVAPNFAYNLCAARISDKALEGLDLSSLRVAMCGAEPIRLETYEAFLNRFRPHGFKDDTFLPVYGLAESTVASTFPQIHSRPTIIWIDRQKLEGEHEVSLVASEQELAVPAFGLGQPFPESAAQIRDPETGEPMAHGQIGEIALKGPSVMQGYFRNPEKTAEVLQDGWLLTGDLGFVMDGHLYVTGRKKDLIIRYGRNYYPQDIEAVVETVEGTRKGCVIAFGHMDAERQTEEIIVLAETRLSEKAELDALRTRVKEALSGALGFVPDRIELLPPHTLLKTSSGKLRRKPSKEMYLAGQLKPRQDSLIDQIKVVAGSQLHWGKRKLDEMMGGRS